MCEFTREEHFFLINILCLVCDRLISLGEKKGEMERETDGGRERELEGIWKESFMQEGLDRGREKGSKERWWERKR